MGSSNVDTYEMIDLLARNLSDVMKECERSRFVMLANYFHTIHCVVGMRVVNFVYRVFPQLYASIFLTLLIINCNFIYLSYTNATVDDLIYLQLRSCGA